MIAAGSFLLALAVSLLLDRAVRPRAPGWRSWQGLALHLSMMVALFGLFLGLSGSAPVASALASALLLLFVVASNAKYAMLGEPLLFSDLALVAGMFRHPTFYLTALSARQKAGGIAAALALLPALARLFVPRVAPHLAGAGLLLLGIGGIATLLGRRASAGVAQTPDMPADLGRHGLIASLLLYWRRWRETPDPPACSLPIPSEPARGAAEIIIVVQCESFSDPVDLTGNAQLALPGLARARASAWQWGDLRVSGFGAYTMRTEFGLLFGRSEDALGFRRFDPFLTARGEASYALPARLGTAGYRCLFVHPHDLRFYARDRLMPAIGFDRVIGEDSFPAVTPGQGRYVDDRTLGAALGRLADTAVEPTFLYAVTMENHGPWMKGRVTGSPGGLGAYLHHLRSSDAMLTGLTEHLIGAGRPALLVFFGDHRPSIPGVTAPGPVRHTPYVMVRFGEDGQVMAGENARADLTPDQLHHAILHAISAEHPSGTAQTTSTG